MPTIIAPGTTKTTMFCKANLKNTPTKGIKLKLTIPANIKATAATKNGCVSFAVRLKNPTKAEREKNLNENTNHRRRVGSVGERNIRNLNVLGYKNIDKG